MKLRDLLVLARNGEKEACLAMLQRFDGLIRKYTKKLLYEDAEQDLICYFIELICTFPIEKFGEEDEGRIVVYITKSIHNEYIHLLKLLIKRKQEMSFSSLSEEQLHVLDGQMSGIDSHDELFFIELRQNMQENEWDILKKIYVEGMSVSQIAKEKGISRQAVNQMKNRVLERIKHLYKN